MKRLWILLLSVLLFAACSTVPLPSEQTVPITAADDVNQIHPPSCGSNTSPNSLGCSTAGTSLYTHLTKKKVGENVEHLFGNFVYNGAVTNACLGRTGAGLTMTLGECTGYNAGIRGTETGSITFLNNTTTWVAMDACDQVPSGCTSNNPSLPNFTRVSGTHYLTDAIDALQPAMAADSQLLMKVTTSSGAISTVSDFRNTSQQIVKACTDLVCPVTAFGADPTGSADSGPAFNQTITQASSGAVYVPRGKYKITTTINETGKNGGVLKCAKGIVDDQSAILIGNTGSAPVIDETGSNGVLIQGCAIDTQYSSPPNPSTIGILQARAPAVFSDIAQQNVLRDVVISLATNPSANNNVGTIAVYNYGAEITLYDDPAYFADVGLFLTASNATVGVTSQYQTIKVGTVSMSQVTVNGGSLSGYAGPVFECEGLCANVDLGNLYMNDSGQTRYDFCVKGGQFQRLMWRGRCENERRLLELTSGGALNSSYLNVLVAATGSLASIGPIQIDTGAGTCPTIYYGYMQIQDSTQTGGSLISERGVGCTGKELTDETVDFIQGGGLTLAQGSADDLRAQGNIGPATVSLPAGSHVSFPDGFAWTCSGSAPTIAANTTNYLACGENSGQAALTTAAAANVLLNRACYIRNFIVFQAAAANANTPVYTIDVGGAPSAVRCTVPNGRTTCSDTADVATTTVPNSVTISAANPSAANATGIIQFAFDADCL